MKRVYLIHGWGGKDYSQWFPWLEEALKKKGFEVKSLDLPNEDEPTIEAWVGHLEEEIPPEEIDEQTYFVGHSVGCQTIIRFLEKLHKHKRIAGCVFVAGWFKVINLEPEELELARPWENNEIHFERVLDHCNHFLALFSTNDPHVHLDEAEKFKKQLGAEIIIKKDEEHFVETKEIPEILHFIK